MQASPKIKIGPFLVVSSVLAVWTFLAAQHVQAHDSTVRLPTPSCGNLPSEAGFLPAIPITASGLTADESATTRGGGVTGRGDSGFRYARITVPPLTAGELRVFDATADDAGTTDVDESISDAVLCRGSSPVARSITSYTAHNAALTAAARADDGDANTITDAAGRATDAVAKATDAATAANAGSITFLDADGTTTNTGVAAYDVDNDGDIDRDDLDTDNDGDIDEADAAARTNNQRAATALRSALGTARSALTTARSALTTARNNLNAAVRALNAANATSASITAATNAEQAALTAYNATAHPPSSQPDLTELSNVSAALNTSGTVTTAAPALTAASSALTAASSALTNAANAMHTGFQIRASVSPGDSEYIVVVASQTSATATVVDVAFHGAIDAAATAASITGELRAGAAPTYSLLISAPGLLTVETTGSTDTVGTLDGPGDIGEVSHAESGGSGDNFKFVAPVPANSANYTLTVAGQTSTTAGDYALDMDFNVAMAAATAANTITGLTGVTVADAPAWNTVGTSVPADDTMLQIQRRAADGNVADEDYFLLTVGDDSGVLTVEANDATDAANDADTKGTLFGAMGEGPMMEMRTGQIATDADSGPGAHFRFTVPVEAGERYLVKVEGTDGGYALQGSFVAAVDHDGNADTDTITPPTAPIAGNLTASTGTTQNANRYLFSITESGALYLHTTGTTDVTGTLYGPDGTPVARDENSGDGNNFRIAVNVGPGLYLLEVKGAARSTAGDYSLVTNFVAGVDPTDPTDPTTPTTPGTDDEIAELRAEVTRLQNELDECREPVVTDARGSLDNPSGGGYRSGIGVISGWVCAAEEVTVEILRGGVVRNTLTVAHGTSRPDTVGQCGHSSPNTGFGMTYNFNHLPEGLHTIRALADDELIGSERTFTVVHIRPFAANDTDRFVRGLRAAECRVEDFPVTGEDTFLLWEESTQNFVIEDQG